MPLDTEALWRTALELVTHGHALTMKAAIEDALEAHRVLGAFEASPLGSEPRRRSPCKSARRELPNSPEMNLRRQASSSRAGQS